MKKLILLTLIVAAFIGCSKDEPDLISLPLTEKTLNYKQEYQIQATSKSAIAYFSVDEYHATVDESGLVKARYVGETDIELTNAESTARLKIIVAPTINLYPEPDVKYGMSKSEVISKFGTPYGSTSNAIVYNNYSNKAPELLFLFDDNGKLIAYSLFVKISYVPDLLSFLEERYILIDVNVEEYTTIFINGLTEDTATLAISTGLYDMTYYMVAYIFTENLKSASLIDRQTFMTDKLKENFKQLVY